jgi:hypothetical protein
VTPTITPQQGPSIISVLVYPNPLPAGQDLLIRVRISGCPAEMTMRVYTQAYRRVLDKKWSDGLSYPELTLDMPRKNLGGFANGTYYYILEMQDCNGRTTASKAGTFLIIR